MAEATAVRQEVLLGVLRKHAETFPEVERITAYGRSHTLARKSVEQLAELRQAGLTRVHVGLETGHDPLLELAWAQLAEAPVERRIGAPGVRDLIEP